MLLTLQAFARGKVIDHEALFEELKKGEWTALLDVTGPEPLPQGHPIYDLPNCFITLPIAGSYGYERRDMLKQTIEEIRR